MSAYSLDHDPSYQVLGTTRDDDIRKIPRFNGKSVQDKWNNDVRLHLFTEDFNLLGVDFPFFRNSGTLVCSAKAWTLLKALVAESVEVFPVNCDDGEFYALNVLRVIDCFDYSRSKFERFDDGRISSTWKRVFLPGCYGDEPIFKIQERVLTAIFVTDRFKEIVEQNELKGLIFSEVEE